MATVRSRFPAHLASAAAARRFVRETLRGWGATGAVDDAVLLTSELVTNAVVHAGTPVEVVCRLAGTAVEVDVVDRAPARTLPATGEAAADRMRTNGRGLLLPAELAGAWGVTYTGDTKTVWFRIDTDQGNGAHPSATCAGPAPRPRR